MIIFNDNSTYPDAVRFLDRLAASGVHVHDNPRAWRQFDELFEIVADFVDIYTKVFGLGGWRMDGWMDGWMNRFVEGW